MLGDSSQVFIGSMGKSPQGPRSRSIPVLSQCQDRMKKTFSPGSWREVKRTSQRSMLKDSRKNEGKFLK